MTGFFLWFILAILCFLAAAMLASYALWYYENQKVLDLANHIKANNQSSSILNTGMGKRAFSTFDLNASIAKSKTVAKNLADATVRGVSGIASTVSKSDILGKVGTATKKTITSLTDGLGGLVKPVRDAANEDVEKMPEPELTVEEIKQQQYEDDVDKIIEEEVVEKPASRATIDLASNADRAEGEDMTVFEKLELRILNRLKESGMTNYDIWLELGGLYKKFGQQDKAREVFALVLKHAGGKNKEIASNELIGLG